MTDAIDLAALRAFTRVAELGSLARAATAMEVAQSGVSRRVAALETALGGRLFHRTGRGAAPTALGLRLLPRARAVLAELDALAEDARGESASPGGTVDLGLVPAVARPLVAALTARLRREAPRIRLRVLEAYSGQVEEWLADGRIDIGLFNRYSRGAVRGAEPFLESDIVLVRAGRPGKAAELPFRALAGIPLVLPPRPNSLVAAVFDLATRHQVPIDLALEAGSPALIRDAVERVGLATLVPQHFAEREYGGFAVARVIKPTLRQRTWLMPTTRRPATLAARTVARVLRELRPGA